MKATSWVGCGGAVGGGESDRLKQATPVSPPPPPALPAPSTPTTSLRLLPPLLRRWSLPRPFQIHPTPPPFYQPPPPPSSLPHGAFFPRLGRGRHRACAAPFVFFFRAERLRCLLVVCTLISVCLLGAHVLCCALFLHALCFSCLSRLLLCLHVLCCAPFLQVFCICLLLLLLLCVLCLSCAACLLLFVVVPAFFSCISCCFTISESGVGWWR